MHSNSAPSSKRPPAPLALLLLSVALLLLSLFQWMELLVVRSGGTTVCAINATINCEKVWDSPFAVRVHQITHVPVAGWGTVYALAALALSVLLFVRRRQGKPEGAPVAGLQWTALAGMVSCLIFAFASARAGALCLTCLSTYVLTFGFAAAAFLMLPMQLLPPTTAALDGLLMAAGLVVVGFLVVLLPGQYTPHAERSALAGVAQGAGTQGPITLETLVPRLSPEDLQALSDATSEYQRSAAPIPSPPTRLRNGPASATLQVVEFTDILCPHCRHFTESLEQVRELAPPGAISVEPRHYPLDHECNPFVPRSDNTGTHCLAARALICLEATPPVHAKVSASLFAHQAELNVEKARQLIAAEGVDLNALDACMAQPETAAKLQADEEYAQALHIRGTPLVLVNGRESYPAPVFLYAMVLANGDIKRLAALPLPPPTPHP